MQVRISHIYLQAFLQLVPLDMKNAAVSSSVRLSAPHRISTLFFSFVNSRQTSKGGRSEFPRRPIEIRVKNCCRCRNSVSAAIAQRGHVSYAPTAGFLSEYPASADPFISIPKMQVVLYRDLLPPLWSPICKPPQVRAHLCPHGSFISPELWNGRWAAFH